MKYKVNDYRSVESWNSNSKQQNRNVYQREWMNSTNTNASKFYLVLSEMIKPGW